MLKKIFNFTLTFVLTGCLGYLAYTGNTAFNDYILVFYTLISLLAAVACAGAPFVVSNQTKEKELQEAAKIFEPVSKFRSAYSTGMLVLTSLALIKLGMPILAIVYVTLSCAFHLIKGACYNAAVSKLKESEDV